MCVCVCVCLSGHAEWMQDHTRFGGLAVSQICSSGVQPWMFRARQRSGEGVVRRNGCPKFWTTVSPRDPFAAPLARPEMWKSPSTNTIGLCWSSDLTLDHHHHIEGPTRKPRHATAFLALALRHASGSRIPLRTIMFKGIFSTRERF